MYRYLPTYLEFLHFFIAKHKCRRRKLNIWVWYVGVPGYFAFFFLYRKGFLYVVRCDGDGWGKAGDVQPCLRTILLLNQVSTRLYYLPRYIYSRVVDPAGSGKFSPHPDPTLAMLS